MNDNQNYFVTRSTSRVLAEPGGSSSIFFGEAPAPKTNKSRDKVTQNATPQSDNAAVAADSAVAAVVSPTDVAARIKAQQESGELELFAAPPAKSKGANDDSDKEEALPIVSPLEAAVKIKKQQEKGSFDLFGTSSSNSSDSEKQTTSSNAFASASTTNSYNVLTDRPTSRVNQPPGGASSIFLG